MKYFNWKSLVVISGLALSSPASFAQGCLDWSGEYINNGDTARPTVKITQQDCSRLTIEDNGGNSWPIYLDGRNTPLAPEIARALGVPLTDAYYSATLDSNVIHIKAHTKMPMEQPFRITPEIEYEGDAFLLDFQVNQRRQIQLEARSLRILSVGGSGVVSGQTAGFLQGANWILDIAKHMLDTVLL